jgi:exopolyphosphatase / guanosine-5'-triphosphate,3'-diphosphate pyrophosphatase
VAEPGVQAGSGLARRPTECPGSSLWYAGLVEDLHPGPVAAIDCGTNSTRLLVVDAGNTLTRLMRVTRLGQGVDANRKLEVEAVDRTLAVLSEFRRAMDRLGVRQVRMVATSAVRDAVNGQEFLDAASEVVGARAELLSGGEEGRLAYAGATAGLEPATGGVVVVDIGGGSTELITEDQGRVEVASLDLGCVRLTERFLHHDPPTPVELATAITAIGGELEHALTEIPALQDAPSRRLVGLAGTVSTLAALELGVAAYDRDRVHHAVLPLAVVRRWCTTLATESSALRARRAGMVPGREDVIVGGVLVLQEVMARLGVGECLVSESDILDGLAASLLDG